MDTRIKDLLDRSNGVFTRRLSILSLWQEIAEQFYPERADFTANRNVGTEFASNLTTSYPIMARRSLGDTFSGMLRPKDRDWFAVRTDREEAEDNDAKRWMERAAKIQRNAMYDRQAQFVRATKQGDHDFATFGQCVLSVEMNNDKNALLYRNWHLRDMAWLENEDGSIGAKFRNWKPTLGNMHKLFKGKISPQYAQHLEKDRERECVVRHAVIPACEWDMSAIDPRGRAPYVSIFFDLENEFLMQEVPSFNPYYIIPRWQTVSGSQYAYSPAVTAALPDARLLQAISLILLEAGEKAIDPPMVAMEGVIKSSLDLFAGGVTWADAEYDERLGDALRPIPIDKSGLNFGMALREDTRSMIHEAFYLNKVSMPTSEMTRAMTAFEVGQRVQEYVRGALPLFEPMEMDYNGALCDVTFDILMRNGAFGPREDIPESIQGRDLNFVFTSPLSEAADRVKGQRFQEAKAMLAEAASFDQSIVSIMDAKTAVRDVLTGIGTPSNWLRSEKDVQAVADQQAQQAQTQQTLSLLGQGAQVAQQVGDAGAAIQQIQQTPQGA